MSFTPLLAIVGLLAFGATVTLTILFRASQTGLFRNLQSGAYVIFDDDEPVGEPQDQLFYQDAASPPAGSADSAPPDASGSEDAPAAGSQAAGDADGASRP
jgi:hypothetical protein